MGQYSLLGIESAALPILGVLLRQPVRAVASRTATVRYGVYTGGSIEQLTARIWPKV